MKLSIEARAQLAEKLILSLDAPSEEENLRFWVAEAEKRLNNLRDGKAQEISAEELKGAEKLGFMAGEISAPDDFDSLGAPAIMRLFEGSKKPEQKHNP